MSEHAWSTADHRLVAIFDGTCGFCHWSLQLVARRMDCPLELVPYQTLNDERRQALGMSNESLETSLHVCDSSLRVYAGARAFNRLLLQTAASPFVAMISRYAMLLAIEDWIYRVVASNRSWISARLNTSRFAVLDESGRK